MSSVIGELIRLFGEHLWDTVFQNIPRYPMQIASALDPTRAYAGGAKGKTEPSSLVYRVQELLKHLQISI